MEKTFIKRVLRWVEDPDPYQSYPEYWIVNGLLSFESVFGLFVSRCGVSTDHASRDAGRPGAGGHWDGRHGGLDAYIFLLLSVRIQSYVFYILSHFLHFSSGSDAGVLLHDGILSEKSNKSSKWRRVGRAASLPELRCPPFWTRYRRSFYCPL